MLLRVVVVTTLLISAIYIESAGEPLSDFNPLYVLIVVTYLATLVAILALRAGASTSHIAFVQAVLDIGVVTGLVYLAGASEPRTGFMVLYPLAVLAASTLVRPRPTIVLAVGAVMSFVGLHLALRSGLVPVYGPKGARFIGPQHLVFSALILAVSCVGVAWIGGYLVENLRAAGMRLEEAADEVSSLREVNEAIIHSVHSGFITADQEGRVVYINPHGARVLGVDPSSVRGRRLAEMFDSRLLDAAALGARAARRELERMELVYDNAAGVRVDLGASVTPLAAGNPELGSYLFVFRDLTDVRKLEREARINEKLAAVGEMAAQLAHEIRNPLGAISGSAQVLLAEPGVSPEQAELLTIITRESRRLSETLNQFLRGTRPIVASLDLVDLGPVVAETVTLLRNSPELARGRSVHFEAGDGPHVCQADPDRIKQVVWNLARNGIEAMPDGGRLEIRLESLADEVLLTVSDEGHGIQRRAGERMFEPFHPGTKSGTGLGLAIVYAIVREHRGAIRIHSRVGGGTDVDVRLPRPAAASPT